MQKEICIAIRERFTHYKGKTDEWIVAFSDVYPRIVELISNEGLTIEEAVKKF